MTAGARAAFSGRVKASIHGTRVIHSAVGESQHIESQHTKKVGMREGSTLYACNKSLVTSGFIFYGEHASRSALTMRYRDVSPFIIAVSLRVTPFSSPSFVRTYSFRTYRSDKHLVLYHSPRFYRIYVGSR